MKTKNTYCGDGWEFEITTDETEIYLSMKQTKHPKLLPVSLERYELEELRDFLNNFLISTNKPPQNQFVPPQFVPPMREPHTCC